MTDERLLARLRGRGNKDTTAAADRIEALTKERDDYAFRLADANNTYSEMHVALSEANDKLAKAVELLTVCRDMFDEVAHPSDPLSRMLNDTLAEIEGTNAP